MIRHLFSSFIFLFIISPTTDAWSQRLKDFRGTPQTMALVGLSAEFLDSNFKEPILQQMRKNLNRFSRSYGDSSISSFKLGQNLNDQFFRPVSSAMSDSQKQFLKNAAKDNSVDIFVLASVREGSEPAHYEMEAQLFDSRIEVLSAVEKVNFNRNTQTKSLDDLTYRLANYLDKDGFVHPSAQDLLEKPVTASSGMAAALSTTAGGEDFSVNPTDLSGGNLAGKPVIGGEKTPFWEKWWFWGLVVGGAATAGGLSYYFLVVDKDPTSANVRFRFPQ